MQCRAIQNEAQSFRHLGLLWFLGWICQSELWSKFEGMSSIPSKARNKPETRNQTQDIEPFTVELDVTKMQGKVSEAIFWIHVYQSKA